MITAADIGYSSTKALAGNGRRIEFPSEVGPERAAVFSLSEAHQVGLVIQLDGENGQRWNVGETALKLSGQSAGRRDASWVVTEVYRVLLCAALSGLHKGATTTNVVTGLPLEHHAANSERAKAVFQGSHRFRRNGGRWQTVVVEQCVVVTQPYGALMNMALDQNGKFLTNPFSTGVVGIADIGGMTLNLLVVDSMQEVARWTRGSDFGLLKSLDAVARSIRKACPGISPRTREVAEWIADGKFRYQGQDHDIMPYALSHLEPLVQIIADSMSEAWDEPGRLDAVALTGGGIAALAPMLKLDGTFANVTIVEDPVFGNVGGYLKLASRLWG